MGWGRGGIRGGAAPALLSITPALPLCPAHCIVPAAGTACRRLRSPRSGPGTLGDRGREGNPSGVGAGGGGGPSASLRSARAGGAAGRAPVRAEEGAELPAVPGGSQRPGSGPAGLGWRLGVTLGLPGWACRSWRCGCWRRRGWCAVSERRAAPGAGGDAGGQGQLPAVPPGPASCRWRLGAVRCPGPLRGAAGAGSCREGRGEMDRAMGMGSELPHGT